MFFDLDNEPNYWIGTHPELYPNDCSNGSVPWDDVVSRNVKAATAIKKVWGSAKVFGPVVSGDGMAYGGDYNSPYFVAGTEEFSDYYLSKMAAASVAAGEPLIDSFDVHYYTVGKSDAECLESPRLFWDPDATDISAAETNSLDFDYGDHSYWDMYWYPRQTIPRLQRKMAAAYGGQSTAPPGLSFSEYNPGCETAISGGVAEADLLGIFGREGVYAATAWPLKGVTTNGALANYLVAAFDLYRNYDGAGSTVGDTAVLAQTTDVENTSVYAFTQSNAPGHVDVVAINKSSGPLAATVQIECAPALTTVAAYALAGSKTGVAAVSPAPAVSCSGGTCTVSLTLPALSATTSDSKNTSVYAFTHSTEAGAAEIVAINKLATAESVTIQLGSSPAFHTAVLYHLVNGKAAVVAVPGAAPAVSCSCDACSLTFTMPATSATTVVLR